MCRYKVKYVTLNLEQDFISTETPVIIPNEGPRTNKTAENLNEKNLVKKQ